jgi:hypothetical protein
MIVEIFPTYIPNDPAFLYLLNHINELTDSGYLLEALNATVDLAFQIGREYELSISEYIKMQNDKLTQKGDEDDVGAGGLGYFNIKAHNESI